MKMKKSVIAMLSIFAILTVVSCKDNFLVQTPTAALSGATLSTQKGVEGLLIGAYAELNGESNVNFYGAMSNWLWGGIRGGDANKGSNAGDQADAGPISRYETQPTNSYLGGKWQVCYEGISRCNQTLIYLAAASDISADNKKRIAGEARFLRAIYHFELKKIWGNIPFIDETKTYGNGVEKVKNDVSAWPMIEADFKNAYDNLPETQSEAGRVNKWAAGSFLAKVYMFQNKFTEAKALFDQIIANGKTTNGQKYGLMANYTDLFDPAFDNNKESIFAFQATSGSGNANNSNADMVLNFPYNGGPAGCCGFNQPSFDLANSFRVDAKGLPLLDNSYRMPANELKTDQGLLSSAPFKVDDKTVDPRLDYSIGRRGVPYLDWGPHPGFDWVRDQSYGGPYAPRKFIFPKSQQASYTDGSSWTAGYTAINLCLIRYADLLLLAAEAEVEVGSLEKAREYTNLVRTRASNPAAFIKNGNVNAANYKIGNYTTVWTDKAAARTAVRFERRLELSGEGHRMFDLVRWGVAAQEMNAYFAYEGSASKLPLTLGGATFVAGKHELLPIPQGQIDAVGSDILKQNAGY